MIRLLCVKIDASEVASSQLMQSASGITVVRGPSGVCAARPNKEGRVGARSFFESGVNKPTCIRSVRGDEAEKRKKKEKKARSWLVQES